MVSQQYFRYDPRESRHHPLGIFAMISAESRHHPVGIFAMIPAESRHHSIGIFGMIPAESRHQYLETILAGIFGKISAGVGHDSGQNSGMIYAEF